MTLYELRAFVALVRDADPFIMEMLFTDRLCHKSEEWRALLELRPLFLTRRAVERFVMYARRQLTKYEEATAGGKIVPGKRIYHVFRLLQLARDVLEKKPPQVWLEPGERRDFLVRVRADEVSRDELVHLAHQQLSAMEATQPEWAHLGDLDAVALERWAFDLRRAQLVRDRAACTAPSTTSSFCFYQL